MLHKEESSRRVLSLLKQILKEKGITYACLAQELNVSHATVKRLLNGVDLPISRLTKICAVLGVDAAEVLASARTEPLPEGRLYTEQEEEFFVRHPYHLAYFTELCRGKSPGFIARKHGISKESTDIYLKNLENGGFIRVVAGRRIKILVNATGSWRPGGPLMRRHAQRVIDHIHQQFEAQHIQATSSRGMEGSTGVMNHVWYWFSRKSTRETYVREVHEATERFMRAAGREIQMDGDQALEPFLMALFMEGGEQYRGFLADAVMVPEVSDAK